MKKIRLVSVSKVTSTLTRLLQSPPLLAFSSSFSSFFPLYMHYCEGCEQPHVVPWQGGGAGRCSRVEMTPTCWCICFLFSEVGASSKKRGWKHAASQHARTRFNGGCVTLTGLSQEFQHTNMYCALCHPEPVTWGTWGMWLPYTFAIRSVYQIVALVTCKHWPRGVVYYIFGYHWWLWRNHSISILSVQLSHITLQHSVHWGAWTWKKGRKKLSNPSKKPKMLFLIPFPVW